MLNVLEMVDALTPALMDSYYITLCLFWIVIVHVFFLTHEFSYFTDKT